MEGGDDVEVRWAGGRWAARGGGTGEIIRGASGLGTQRQWNGQ